MGSGRARAPDRGARLHHGVYYQCIIPSLTVANSRGACEMVVNGSFYFGNAAVDQVRGTGWFVGQFVPPEIGLRHQTDVELKWAIHPDGDQRTNGAESNRNATTISVLIRGTLRTTFEVGGTSHVVTLAEQGDYVIFGLRLSTRGRRSATPWFFLFGSPPPRFLDRPQLPPEERTSALVSRKGFGPLPGQQLPPFRLRGRAQDASAASRASWSAPPSRRGPKTRWS